MKKYVFFGLASVFLLVYCSSSTTLIKWLNPTIQPIQSNSKPIDHQLYDSLLYKYVSDDGLVDYKGFIEDSTAFYQYLDLLSDHHPNDIHWSRDEQLAYWINAYNAFTIKLIMDHYPVKSIKAIKGGIPFVNSVWDIKFIKIESESYSLNNIEHGIIRANWEEPRIHFAVNCASISCPNLRNEAYITDRLDSQLTDAAHRFFHDTTKNVFGKDTAEISSLMKWYEGDFTKEEADIRSYLNQYSPIHLDENTSIDYLDYDWGLNEL